MEMRAIVRDILGRGAESQDKARIEQGRGSMPLGEVGYAFGRSPSPHLYFQDMPFRYGRGLIEAVRFSDFYMFALLVGANH